MGHLVLIARAILLENDNNGKGGARTSASAVRACVSGRGRLEGFGGKWGEEEEEDKC